MPICCSQAQYISSPGKDTAANRNRSPLCRSRSLSRCPSCATAFIHSLFLLFFAFLFSVLFARTCSPSFRLLFVVKVSGIWLGLVYFWDSFILLRLPPAAAALQWHKTRHFHIKMTLYIYIYQRRARERGEKSGESLIYLNNVISISILQIRNFHKNFNKNFCCDSRSLDPSVTPAGLSQGLWVDGSLGQRWVWWFDGSVGRSHAASLFYSRCDAL